ncbi:polycystic kidney disease and receptor for egg jelly-related protein-like [Thamnophis elegans]|uniref:polycystic kidney disease and receptor for egg jelly-related protein-like n=1 Tax=Thamnophis elegans TaxID=35005 RepID=UPI0013775398|nr:polycystic kidney disease and receptor for egg jelly-related protein-like [Thamnophis elegans]
MSGATDTIFFLGGAGPFLWPLLFLFCWFGGCPSTLAAQLHLMPPPLSVTCAKPENRVYQQQDLPFQVSCLWDSHVVLHYSKAHQQNSKEEGAESPVPPLCHWYRDAILVNQTTSWTGELMLSPGLPWKSPHPPWAGSRISMQCISVSCLAPLCLYHNLSIEVVDQDIHLFLLQPHTLPILERQPVWVGWCARLKSSAWRYYFESQGGLPEARLIPTNQHNEPLLRSDYPTAKLHQVCMPYYSYHLTVQYPRRGSYIASVSYKPGPRSSLSLDFLVEPALLFVFRVTSQLQRPSQGALSFSWNLQQLSPEIVAYQLLDTQRSLEWSHSYDYNPFGLHSHFCAVPTSHQTKETVVASVYFRTSQRVSTRARGSLDFLNRTLIFRTSRTSSISIRLNPQENTISTYIFSRAQGLYYSTQKGNLSMGLAKNSSLCYVLYQQAGLSYLITVKFVQLQLFRFSLDIYLNRKEALFQSLGEKETDVYVFNSTSPDNSLAYVVWFIPAQHPLLQCEWAFNLQVFNSVDGHLVENSTFAYIDRTPNAAHFLPDSAPAFHPDSYAGFVARVKCLKRANIPIVFTARFNIYALKVIESQIACQQKTCTIPKVRIHRGVNTKHILHYAQETGFTLAADMRVNCPGPKSTKVSWNIYKVSNLSDKPDWSKPFNPTGIEGRHFIRLKIPCSSLDTGLYLFNFTVQLISPTFPQMIERSDAVLIEVGSDLWGAVIMGGHFRSVGFSDRWILKGSVLSNGEMVSLSQGLSYTWYCTKQERDYTSMALSTVGKCYPDQVDLKWTTSSNSIQMVLPETLQANNTYHFLLLVQNGSRITQAQQTVHVRAHGALVLNIACTENCGTSVIPTERFSLSGKCGNCREIKSWYYWSLRSAQSHEIKFDWSSRTTTGRSSSYLHFKAFALVSMAEEFYILSLKVVTQNGQSSSCEYFFYINAPPQIGKCVLHPKEGIAFLTKFTIQCHGFEDRNQPLAYKVIAASDQMTISSISSIQNNTLGIIIYVGHESKTPWSFLPPGRPSQTFALPIYVQVFDALGASSQVTLQATVLDQRQPPTNAVLHQQLYDLMNGSSALMTKLLITKDYLSIGYIVYMMAAVLNNIEASPSNRVPKADLRQHLLNISTGIPSTSIGEINQVILSICQATHEIAEVDKISQLLAVRKLKTVSQALRRHRNQGLGSKETEILSNGIFTGLSNILDASLLNHRNPNADAIKEAISVTEILTDLILQGKVPGGNETKMVTRNWSIHLWKSKTWDISGTFSKRKRCRSCFYPTLKQGSHVELEEDNVVSTILYEFEQNPFPWLAFADNIGTIVTGFKMAAADSKGDLTTIVPDMFEIILTRTDKAIFELTIGPDKKLPKTTGGFGLEIKRNSSDIFIQLVPQVNITFQVFIYLGLNLSHPPLLLYNASHLSPPTVLQEDTIITGCALNIPYIFCLPKSLLWSPAYNRVADTLNLSIVLQSQPIVRHQTAKSLRVAIFAAGCLSLEGVQDQWKEEPCSLGPQTSWSKIHCVCQGKKNSTKSTRSDSRGASGPGVRFLAGKLLLFPNQVDMKMLLLQPMGRNPVPGFMVLAVFLLYIFLAVWVRRKDKIDIEEQIIYLPDNDPFHTTRYLVTIYTGSRPSAGTKADVFIELIGQNGKSDVHLLKHPSFPEILQNSCIDTFMLTTGEDLGDLVSIHIWHNYCGFGPNWYLSRIKILSVDTNRSWLFLCRKWLALGRNNYQIEWTFEVTDPQVPISRTDYLLIMFSYHWFQDHLWFSIFVRSLDSSWNRFQRLSCCLAILLTSLLVNTIIFNTKKEEQVYLLELQYLRSIIAGVLGALISLPVGWIAISLFKYSVKGSSQCNLAQGQEKESFPWLLESLFKADTQLSEIKSQQFSATDTNVSNNYAAEKKATLGKTQKSQWGRCLSCSAWFFVFLISGLASFFITFIGQSFDHKTSSEWLIAALISFCLHVSFFETLQIVVYSSWNICLAKYCANIPWQGFHAMTYTPRTLDADEMEKLHNDLVELRASKKYQPIKEEDVIAMQKKKLIQYLAYKYVKDMICHFIFLGLIFAISHPIDVTAAFFYNRAMSREFSPDLPDLNGAQDVYRWVNKSFLPLIHNPYHPSYLPISGSKILGLPRMRQIRKKYADRCLLPYELKNMFLLANIQCKNKYGFSQEDQSNYVGSWSTPTDTSVPKNHAEFLGFSYEPSSAQWEYISYGQLNDYPSRGYTFYFFPEEPQVNSTQRLDALETNSWIDNKTWAVIFELTTFNVDANMFCSISVIFELSFLGPVNASIVVHSYKLPFFTHQNMSEIFFFCLTIYILIIYIADECHMMYQEQLSYFTLATNLINFGIKTNCILFLVVLLCKFKLSSDLVQFYLLHSQEFVPFHTASQFDQTVRGVLGILVFFLVLKTYRYVRFLFDLRLAQKTLRTALAGIINIIVMGIIFFNAYMALGYVGFGQHEWHFRSLMYSFTTVLSYCALTFKDTEFLSDKFLGGLFLASFLLMMICVFVNLSQILIMSAHSDMKEVVFNEPSNEADVMYFILQKVYRMWYFASTGTYTKSETDIFNTILYGKFKKRRKQPLRKRLGKKERLYVVV